MTDKELAQALTGALDERIARAETEAAPRPAVVRLPQLDQKPVPIRAVPARQLRWKAAVAALLALVMLGGAGLAAFKLMDRTEPTTPGNTEPSPSEVQTTEPTEPVEPPQVEYDAETKTIHITGTSGYDQADLSPYLDDALNLEVEDDEFHLSASVSVMKDNFKNIEPYWTDFPGYLDSLDRSTSFIRQYITDHAPNERVAALARKPVYYSLKKMASDPSYTNSEERIDLAFGYITEYDTHYALALMSPEVEAWQHLGFACWIKYMEPYSYFYHYKGDPYPPDYDYYYVADYFRAGGTGKTWETEEALLWMDSCSWYNLTHGMSWDGIDFERKPICHIPNHSAAPKDEGNDVSMAMAVSLINYLAQQYGEEQVIAYCFDTCSFEEAFGVSYAAARAAWEQNLMDRFGDGSESAPVEPPQVEYDAETKTIHITGTSGYDQADLTPYMQEAQYLEVEDDEFGFSLSISGIIATTDWSRTYLSDFLPFYLFKLDRTTAFTKQYFAEHAPNEAVAAQARKPVNYSYKTVWATRWENSPEQIDVIMGAYFQYMYDTAYMLAMIDPENESWQHQGFAEWFALVNPYNCNYGETAAVSPDYDYYYYADYFRVGGSGDLCDLKEKFLLYDACSWYNLIHGMNWDGNEYETQRITRSDRAKVDSEIEGNDVSIYMAISLINYLVEQYGEEPVIAYCFDTCSFEEAFGVSYAAARAAWEQSLMDRFGDGSSDITTEPAVLPQVEYDEATKTIRITGTKGYDRLRLASYMSDAQYLEVEDDEFHLSASVSVMMDRIKDYESYGVGSSGYLDRLDRSTSFIRQYITDHAPNEQVAAQARKPVYYSLISYGMGYANSSERIDLALGSYFSEYDAYYTLALMSPKAEMWQHLGFIYWMEGAVDPYNMVYQLDGEPTPPNYNYYYMADYFRVGGTGKTWESKERLLWVDACSWYNLTHGMSWNGTDFERKPINQINMFSDPAAIQTGEGSDMSMAMATSLINYLAQQYGEDKVVAYCFDTCTFEEAFGTDFAFARAAWEQSLMDRFGDGSETP